MDAHALGVMAGSPVPPSMGSESRTTSSRNTTAGEPGLFGVQLGGSAALYVTASELEGMPSSLLECMERARPAVVSDIPPHRELFGQIEGLILKAPQAIVQAAQRLQPMVEPVRERLGLPQLSLQEAH